MMSSVIADIPGRASLRILLVDDMPADRALARRALAQEFGAASLSIVEAGSRQQFDAALAAGDFSLVVTDYQLGWSDGLTILEIVKTRFPDCPVVMFTNSGNEEIAVAALKSGLDDYVVKSAQNYMRLPAAVRGALLRVDARRAAARYQQELQASEARYRVLAEENARLLAEARQLAARQHAFLKDILFAVTDGVFYLCDGTGDLPPPPGTADAVPLPDASALRVLRRLVRERAAACGLPADRASDLLTATGEAAMNAVTHAGGRGEGRVYCAAERERAQVWVVDHGPGIPLERLHRAVLERGFTTAGTLGHGFWLMLKTADRVFLLTGENGTTVVLEKGRTPPQPDWAL